MAKIKIKGDLYLLQCPGCKTVHMPDNTWTFNGNLDKPTLSPSLRVMSGENTVCHSFVIDGNIQFLSDCTHELVGQTVELPEWQDS